MSPDDVARLAATLLEAIERGDLEATPRDIAFLRSLTERSQPARP